VAGGRFAPGHLGELTQQVPFEMVDAVLGQTCRLQRRVRDLPARVVVYLVAGRVPVRRAWLRAGLGPAGRGAGRAKNADLEGQQQDRPGDPGRGAQDRDGVRRHRGDSLGPAGSLHAATVTAPELGFQGT